MKTGNETSRTTKVKAWFQRGGWKMPTMAIMLILLGLQHMQVRTLAGHVQTLLSLSGKAIKNYDDLKVEFDKTTALLKQSTANTEKAIEVSETAIARLEETLKPKGTPFALDDKITCSYPQ